MKILLCDLDGTIRAPKSDAKFINSLKDQLIIPEAAIALKDAVAQDWQVMGVTNQGGVHAEHKTLKDCLLEQRHTLELCPQLHKVYAAISDDECWVVSRGPEWTFNLPTSLTYRRGSKTHHFQGWDVAYALLSAVLCLSC